MNMEGKGPNIFPDAIMIYYTQVFIDYIPWICMGVSVICALCVGTHENSIFAHVSAIKYILLIITQFFRVYASPFGSTARLFNMDTNFLSLKCEHIFVIDASWHIDFRRIYCNRGTWIISVNTVLMLQFCVKSVITMTIKKQS